MDLITGYFKHSRKIQTSDRNTISELYVSDVLNPSRPGEYLVSDGNGCVPVFECIRGRDRFKGHLRYRFGDKRRRFRMAEGMGEKTTLVVDGGYFHIEDIRSDEPTEYLTFSENRLQHTELPPSTELHDIRLEHRLDSTDGSYDSMILSFLRLVEPQCHTRLSYFCVSNISTVHGHVLTSYSNGVLEYHTVVSPFFLNLSELFSDSSLIPSLVGAPYFPHTNFTISHNWEKVYESKEYSFGYDYPRRFILEVLGSVMLEERIVFYSAECPSLQVMGILNLIKPFEWPHILCMPLPSEMEEILESPLPFIVCTDKRLRRSDIVFVDLDVQRVHGAKKHALPVGKQEMSRLKSNLKETVGDYMSSMAREIVLEREASIRGSEKEEIEKVVEDPAVVLGGKHPFYDSFSKTRMFLVFVTKENTHLCRYLVEVGHRPAVVLLPYTLLTDELRTGVLRLWIEMFDGKMDPVVEHLRTEGQLEAVADVVFRRLSHDRDYERIHRVLSLIPNPTHNMYASINIASQMPRMRFGDLCAYTIYHLRGCSCRSLVFEDRETSLQREARKRIRAILLSMEQDMFDVGDRGCSCDSRTSFLLVDKPGYSFLCPLLTPENIGLFLRHPGPGDLLETSPQAHWSIVTYFMYFDLPLTWDVVEEEVQLVVEESSTFDLRIEGRPRLYLNP